MALSTHSVFYYGHVIDENNNLINFIDDGGPEKTATLPVGSYTLTRFLEIVASSLNTASVLTWSASVDRQTRIVTLEASGPASLLFGSGSTYLNAPSILLGFPRSDILTSTTFVGSFGSGSEYRPQFLLQDFKGKDKNKKLANAVVTKSATGDTVSVQSFGVERFIKCNVRFITNQPTSGLLRFDPEGVENAQRFMDYVVEKRPIEFMQDENERETFDRVFLESNNQGDGTAYELTEYVDRNLPGYFETGVLTFKVINRE